MCLHMAFTIYIQVPDYQATYKNISYIHNVIVYKNLPLLLFTEVLRLLPHDQ